MSGLCPRLHHGVILLKRVGSSVSNDYHTNTVRHITIHRPHFHVRPCCLIHICQMPES